MFRCGRIVTIETMSTRYVHREFPYYIASYGAQHGRGFGSFFSSVYRAVHPLASAFGKKVGREALVTGSNMLRDMLTDKTRSPKEIFKSRLSEGINRLISGRGRKVRKTMSGQGRKVCKTMSGQRGKKRKKMSGQGRKVRKTMSGQGRKRKKVVASCPMSGQGRKRKIKKTNLTSTVPDIFSSYIKRRRRV